jgi:excinuclease ABC subunit B
MPAESYAHVAEETAAYAHESPAALARKIKQLEQAMYRHARDLEFEEAAKLRDEIQRIRQFGLGIPSA